MRLWISVLAVLWGTVGIGAVNFRGIPTNRRLFIRLDDLRTVIAKRCCKLEANRTEIIAADNPHRPANSTVVVAARLDRYLLSRSRRWNTISEVKRDLIENPPMRAAAVPSAADAPPAADEETTTTTSRPKRKSPGKGKKHRKRKEKKPPEAEAEPTASTAAAADVPPPMPSAPQMPPMPEMPQMPAEPIMPPILSGEPPPAPGAAIPRWAASRPPPPPWAFSAGHIAPPPRRGPPPGVSRVRSRPRDALDKLLDEEPKRRNGGSSEEKWPLKGDSERHRWESREGSDLYWELSASKKLTSWEPRKGGADPSLWKGGATGSGFSGGGGSTSLRRWEEELEAKAAAERRSEQWDPREHSGAPKPPLPFSGAPAP